MQRQGEEAQRKRHIEHSIESPPDLKQAGQLIDDEFMSDMGGSDLSAEAANVVDSHTRSTNLKTPEKQNSSQVTARSTQTTLEKWTKPRKINRLDDSTDSGSIERSGRNFGLRSNISSMRKGKKAKVRERKDGMNAVTRQALKIKSRPSSLGGDADEADVKHNNPRVQKQLNIAAAKMGKLKQSYGDQIDKEKKEKQKNQTKWGKNVFVFE